ncbi:hypothetical protein HZC09_01870 [Candidatus Micrarchaeota archaeon]|nr:hypothetical protein [Candidatus Micrarchaeota archaeon]
MLAKFTDLVRTLVPGVSHEELALRNEKIKQASLPERELDLIGVDEHVKDFADSIKGADIKVLTQLLHLLRSSRLKYYYLQPHEADLLQYVYLRRTAGEILESGYVVGTTSKEYPARGCADFALVTLALLRAKGIEPGKKAWFVRDRRYDRNRDRYLNHSFVIADIEGSKCDIDFHKPNIITEISDERFRRFVKLAGKKESRDIRVGKDPFHAGFLGLYDSFGRKVLQPKP